MREKFPKNQVKYFTISFIKTSICFYVKSLSRACYFPMSISLSNKIDVIKLININNRKK